MSQQQQELDLQSFLVSPPAFDMNYGSTTQSPAQVPRFNNGNPGMNQGGSQGTNAGNYPPRGQYNQSESYGTSFLPSNLGVQQQQASMPDLSMMGNVDLNPRSDYSVQSSFLNTGSSNTLPQSQSRGGLRSEESALHDLDPNTFHSVSFAMPRFLEGNRGSSFNAGAAFIDGSAGGSLSSERMNSSGGSRGYDGGLFDNFANVPFQFDSRTLAPDSQMASGSRPNASSSSGGARSSSAQYSAAPIGTAQFPGVYSSTGFDIIGILARIALRPNPQIDLGPVDLSASFLVVDAQKYDFPIVYASPTFTKLTGYSQDECTGRNCRFLQTPDGNTTLGSRRQHTDNNAVFHIKTHMLSGKECQASMVNYRKGGQSFINLVTVIPITWNSDEIAYFIGFQIDLVEQPNAILDRLKDGTYVVNYAHAKIPRSLPLLKPEKMPSGSEKSDESDLTKIERNTIPTIPQNIMPVSKQDSPEIMDIIEASEDTDLSRRQWNRMLLEHSDDFIHVLSLKGVFLYVSPSARRLLGYHPDALTGRNISMICHPSDVVPVMRELKESTTGLDDVNLVYRIRRQDNSYMWIESHGKLHLEHGKGRKCVIMVGRQRSVYKLQLGDLPSDTDTIYNQEIWSKLSQNGTILYVTPSAKKLLGFSDQEMIGKNMLTLVETSQKKEYQQALERASGDNMPVSHSLQAKDSSRVSFLTKFFRNADGNDEEDAPAGSDQSFIICQSVMQRSTPLKTNASASGENQVMIKSQPGSIWKTMAGQARSPTDNLFDGLNTSGSTSWQYELHQLRLTNKKLREEVESVLDAQTRRTEKNNFVCSRCNRKGTLDQRSRSKTTLGSCNACGAPAVIQVQPTIDRPASPESESGSVSSSGSSRISGALNQQHLNESPSSSSESEVSNSESGVAIDDEDDDQQGKRDRSVRSNSSSFDMATIASIYQPERAS